MKDSEQNVFQEKLYLASERNIGNGETATEFHVAQDLAREHL